MSNWFKRKQAYFKKYFNPAYSLSPLLLKTVSVESLVGEFPPVVYQPAEKVYCPGFTAMPVHPQMCFLQADYHHSRVADFRVLNNLIYVAEYLSKNLLLTEKRQFIRESSSTMTHARHFKWTHAYRPVDRTYDNLCMVFRGVSNEYYHVLIDNLPRLMALHHPEAKKFGKITLLVTEKVSRVEAELFSRVLPDNVEVEIIEKGRAYFLKRCFFPKFATQQFSGFVPSGVLAWIRKRFCPDRPRRHDRKIFISRALAPKRRLLNEEELIDRLEAVGFVSYKLEELDFYEQVELFYDASVVAGLHGAGFSNLVFGHQVKVLEIFPYQYTKPSYYLLTQAISGDYYYLTTEGDDINVDLSVSVDEVMKLVTEILDTG